MLRMGPPPYPNRKEYPYAGTLNFQGILVYVENPPGSSRSGTDPNGKSWSVKMACYYGEIPGTNGPDGDAVDVFVGPNEYSSAVYVIHQPIINGDDEIGYDEDKVMLGFDSQEQAEKMYQRHYGEVVDICGVSELTVCDLKCKMEQGELDLGAAVTKAMAGPYIGPRGGKWANAAHTIPWHDAEGAPGHRHATAAREVVAQFGGHTKALKRLRRMGDRKVFDAISRQMVPASKLVEHLDAWTPKKPSSDADMVTVHHSTDRDTAQRMLQEGIIPQHKPVTQAQRDHQAGRSATFAPGAGVAGGTYVAKPGASGGYGQVTLELQVPRHHLRVSPEQARHGVEDAHESLATHDGAVVEHAIHPSQIKLVKGENARISYTGGVRDMEKAMPPKPAGSGWVPVLHPRAGRKGWRRLKSGGHGHGYEYWYPVDQKRRTKRAMERTSVETRRELETEMDSLRPTTSGTFNPKTKKYEYTEEYHKRASLYKFVRVAALDRDLGHLNSALEAEVKGSSPTAENATAAVLLVMLLSGMRPGGRKPGKPGTTVDKKTKIPVSTFGATTIQAKHAKVKRDGTVVFDFIGKSGVKRHVEIKNPALARAVRMFKKNAEPDSPLFSYQGRGARRPVVRRHYAGRLRGYNRHYLGKDLRTRVGTQAATAEVARIIEESHDIPEGEKARKLYGQKLVRRVAVAASNRLGNEPEVAIKKYVDPDIVEHMLQEVGLTLEKSDRKYRTLRWLFGDDYVDDWIRHYLDDDVFDDDVEKSFIPAIPAILVKAKKSAPKPPGSGWNTIPGGRRGGYRRRKGKSWEYWYPGQQKIGRAKWEADPTKRPGTADLDPGGFVHVGGRSGLFKWVPGHGTAPGGLAWVQSVTTGSFERVRANTMQPVRKKAASRPKKKAPTRTRKPSKKKARATTRKRTSKPVKKRRTPTRKGRKPKERVPRRKARKSDVYEESTATKGTVLHGVENGEFMLREIVDIEGKRRYGVHIPPDRQADFVKEMRPMIEASARKVARRYGIRVRDSSGVTPGYEELVSGAHVGLAMAISNYEGGSAFGPHASSFATLYAMQAAKSELGAGINITDRTMRILSRFYAARAQARKRFGTMDPTSEQIAKMWIVRKKDTYSGRRGNLGNYTVTEVRPVVRVAAGYTLLRGNRNQVYPTKTAAKAAAKEKGIPYELIRFSGGYRVRGRQQLYPNVGEARKNNEVSYVVNQANETLPDTPWRLKDSSGAEVGPEHPGKLAAIEKLKAIGNMGDVKGDEWMVEHPGEVIPGVGRSLSASHIYAIRAQLDEVLDKMNPKTREVVELAFGVGSKTGEPATLDEIAAKLRIARGRPRAAKRAAAKIRLESAMTVFRALAQEKQSEIARLSVRAEMNIRTGEEEKPPRTPMGPSHNELKDRFGSDERVHMYQTAIRGGFGDHAARVFDKEKDGNATEKEMREIRERVTAHRDAERVRTFNRLYNATPVDPEYAVPWGPSEGSAAGGPTSITYHTDYMVALAKRGLGLLERYNDRGG